MQITEDRSVSYKQWQESLEFTLKWLDRDLNPEKYVPGTLDIFAQIEAKRIAKLESDPNSQLLVLPYTFPDGFTAIFELSKDNLSIAYLNKTGPDPRQFIRTVGEQPYNLPLLIQYNALSIMEGDVLLNWPSLPSMISTTIRNHSTWNF